jgi:hypothetical protein
MQEQDTNKLGREKGGLAKRGTSGALTLFRPFKFLFRHHETIKKHYETPFIC